jgi:hypothetical protein
MAAAAAAAADDAPSVRLMVANHAGLARDLPRLETLVGIARNVLTAGPAAQNAAAKSRLDAAVLRLITACIKITARGFTADGSVAEEEKWQSVIDMCECEEPGKDGADRCSQEVTTKVPAGFTQPDHGQRETQAHALGGAVRHGQ